MFQLLYPFGLKWLYYKDPMTETERQRWSKVRKKGLALQVLFWSVGLGGGLFLFDFCWGRLIDHKSIDGASLIRRIVGDLFVSIVIAVANWYVEESRYRQPEKHQPFTVAQIK